MSQRDKDFAEGVSRYYESTAYAFADGAAYARVKFAHRLRTALEFQRKKCEVDRAFAPFTIEVLEELIAGLEAE